LLVLSRKKNESIVIGGLESGLPEIRVTVVDVVGGHKVRLGIDAPREVAIRRPDAKRQTPRAQTESDAVAGGTGETTLA
jgi:carbon storage regulator CsrA